MATVWFIIVAVMITAYVVLDGFDLGAGIIYLFVSKGSTERRMILRAIGPVWDGNEVWLLAAGGTLYFAFPQLYAAGFSGFYLPLMIVLWLLMLRAVGIAPRAKNEFDAYLRIGAWFDGRWHTLTWRQAGDIVEELALGLLALGRQKGDAVALLSASRVEWVHADMAILSAGCITVPIYPSYPPELIAYVVNDSQARTLIVEDSGQLAKALEARSKMERLEQIVVISGYEPAQPPETPAGSTQLYHLPYHHTPIGPRCSSTSPP